MTELGLDEQSDCSHRLFDYVRLMLKWNRTYNLTALRRVEDVLSQHIFDSLAIVPSLDKYFARMKITHPRILDVGSGAGLPGVVLTIVRPSFLVTCVDAVEKKIAFMRAVKAELGLKNLDAKHARVEQMEPALADMVISRAFASVSEFIGLAQQHVMPNGVLVAMKAKQIEKEILETKAQHPSWLLKEIEPITVPKLNAQRCLLWLQKEQ
jgi:16S rRNA (guanine527-N7)-methyltransferase